MLRRWCTTLGLFQLVQLAGVPRSLAQGPETGSRHPFAARAAEPADTLPEPVLLEMHVGRITSRTVQAFKVRTEALVPLSQFLQLAEIRYRLSPEGRLEATVDPGGVRLVVDVSRDTMNYGPHRVRLEPEFRLFRNGELYVGAERLGDLLGSSFEVAWPDLTVTFLDPRALPIARRLRREAAREALLHPREAVRPDLSPGYDRPRWDGLVFDYSYLAPSGDPVAGAGYTAALGADAFGGSLELTAASVGRAGDGVVRFDGSWTGVWRESRWVRQLRIADGTSTGPRVRTIRGLAVTNAPFIRPSLLGSVRYQGRLEPGGGWSVEAYRGGDLVGLDSVDALGRFTVDLPVRYGENPVDFVAIGPFGEIREFNRTYRVVDELLPPGRFEYGLAGGTCRSAGCTATGNLDLRYGAATRWTLQAGLDQFWRDTLPNRSHFYAGLAGSLSNAWAVRMEGVSGAFARGGVRYEPSLNLRVTGEYTRFRSDTIAPVLTPSGLRSQLSLFGFLRPLPTAGFFFFDGSLERSTTDVGVNTRARLGASAQALEIRLLPFVRLEQDAPHAAASVTRSFVGLNTFILPRPELGRLLGQIWMRTGTELEADGALRLAAFSAFVARPLGSGVRLEAGVSWAQRSPGPTFTLVLTSYLSMLRSYTTVTAAAGAPVSGTQFVQGSVLWDRATGRLASAPGPSLERSGVSGRVFLDQNANGLRDPGEPDVPGVRVRVGTSTAVSDSSGVFRVWDIVPFEPVAVVVDSQSLASPLLVPAFGRASLEPGPNRFRALDIPIVQAGVIEGRVTREVGGRRQGVGGVTLILTDRRTGKRRAFSTFADGDFYALGIKPGDYDLSVDDRVLEALSATAPPLRLTLVPTADGVGASGLEILLRSKP